MRSTRSCSSFSARLKLGPLVDALVAALGDLEGCGHPPVVARPEVADLEFAGVDQREGGRLHAADRGHVAGARAEHAFGERARAVDADQPVALAAAAGGVLQPEHLTAGPELGEGRADALDRHGLHPRALHRQFALGKLIQVGEDQLALASGVAGVDDLGEVGAVEEFLQRVEALLAVLDRFQAELLRHDGQGLQAPETVLFLVDVLRHLELHQVAERVRDDVAIVLVVIAFFGDFAEGAREISGHRGLLGDDK
jgi:hypothetical protein